METPHDRLMASLRETQKHLLAYRDAVAMECAVSGRNAIDEDIAGNQVDKMEQIIEDCGRLGEWKKK